MAQAVRGVEITITIQVANVLRQGIFRNLTKCSVNNRDQLVERELLGRDVPEVDYIHNGWDITCTNQVEDSTGTDLCDELVSLQEQRRPLPPCTVKMLYDFRDPTIPNRLVTYTVGALMNSEEAFDDRASYVTQTWTFKATSRKTQILPA